MKYSNEISCQGNDIDYRFKGIFPLFAFKALINPMNWRNRWLVVPILFVLPRRHRLMKKKIFWLCVSVGPYRRRMVVNFVLL